MAWNPNFYKDLNARVSLLDKHTKCDSKVEEIRCEIEAEFKHLDDIRARCTAAVAAVEDLDETTTPSETGPADGKSPIAVNTIDDLEKLVAIYPDHQNIYTGNYIRSSARNITSIANSKTSELADINTAFYEIWKHRHQVLAIVSNLRAAQKVADETGKAQSVEVPPRLLIGAVSDACNIHPAFKVTFEIKVSADRDGAFTNYESVSTPFGDLKDHTNHFYADYFWSVSKMVSASVLFVWPASAPSPGNQILGCPSWKRLE